MSTQVEVLPMGLVVEFRSCADHATEAAGAALWFSAPRVGARIVGGAVPAQAGRMRGRPPTQPPPESDPAPNSTVPDKHHTG